MDPAKVGLFVLFFIQNNFYLGKTKKKADSSLLNIDLSPLSFPLLPIY